MKLKTLKILWKLRLFKVFFFFLNYQDINYFFESACIHVSFMLFNSMPWVISQWSPDLISVDFVATVSDPSQCHFTLDDEFFLVPMGGRGSLIVCGWGCCPLGQKITCKRGLIWRVLSAAHEGRDKTLKVWMRLLPIGQEIAY